MLTVFNQPGCTGVSTVLKYEKGTKTSGETYSSYDEIDEWPQGSIASMLQPEGTDVEFFQGEDFGSAEKPYTFTHKNFGAQTCREVSDIQIFDAAVDKTGGNFQGITNNYKDYGSRSVQYRQTVFPTDD